MPEGFQAKLEEFKRQSQNVNNELKVNSILATLSDSDAKALTDTMMARNPVSGKFLYSTAKLSSFITEALEPVSANSVDRWRKRQIQERQESSTRLKPVPMPTVGN